MSINTLSAKKKIIINTLMATTALTIAACTTVRDTTDWIPGVDSNKEVKAKEKQEVLEARKKEREIYEDKIVFAPTSRTASEADAKMSVEIGEKYVQANEINREDVGIEVNSGVVTLSGNVNSSESAVNAISIAKSTTGVSRVISRLVVVKVRGEDREEERVQVELPASNQTPE